MQKKKPYQSPLEELHLSNLSLPFCCLYILFTPPSPAQHVSQTFRYIVTLLFAFGPLFHVQYRNYFMSPHEALSDVVKLRRSEILMVSLYLFIHVVRCSVLVSPEWDSSSLLLVFKLPIVFLAQWTERWSRAQSRLQSLLFLYLVVFLSLAFCSYLSLCFFTVSFSNFLTFSKVYTVTKHFCRLLTHTYRNNVAIPLHH